MNKSKIILSLIFSVMILVPFVNIAVADENPSYVGINEGDEYIWKTEFDKDPLCDFYEDAGYSEADAENKTDEYFDRSELDDDVVGWKLYILKIKDEKDLDFKNDEVDYTPYLLNLYETEDWEERDWDRELHNERGIVYDYDEDFYYDLMSWTQGLMIFFVDPKTDWDELAEEFEEEVEDYNGTEDCSADDEKRTFFFMSEENGISTEFEPKGFEEFESISLYTKEGVRLYYEWTYDGDTIIKFELENRYIYENWWWILLTVLGITLLCVVIVIIIKKVIIKRS